MAPDLATPETPPRQRPELPALDLTVLDSFDLHPGQRRVLFACHGRLPDYRPGNDLVFLLPLPDGALGGRHSTIRRAGKARGSLAVDFVMHADAPGPRLARSTKPGDRMQARGPRGCTFLHGTATHLMIGDETALPAPPGASAHAIIEVPGAGRDQLVCEGYWRPGCEGGHEHI